MPVALIGILLGAAFLRWAAPDNTPMWGDQALTLGPALDFIHEGQIPLLGFRSSAHIYHSALWIYLTIPPLALIPRIISVRWFYSALDLLAIAFLYLAVRRCWSGRAAALSAWLYAVHPWLVEYNRLLWNPALIVPASTVALSALLLMLCSHSAALDRWIAVFVIGSAMVGGLHVVALPWMLGCWAVAALIALRARRWRGMAIGLAITGAINLPYMMYLLGPGLEDIKAALYLSRSREPRTWHAIQVTGDLLMGRSIFHSGLGSLDSWRASVLHVPVLDWVMPAVLAFALAVALYEIFSRSPQALTWAALFLWTVIPPLPNWFSSIHPQHYYMLHMFPAPLVAISASLLGRGIPSFPSALRALRLILICGTVALSTWWAYVWWVRVRMEDQHQLTLRTPAWAIERLSLAIANYLQSDPHRMMVILEDSGLDISAYDVIRAFLRTDRIRVVPAHTGLIIPHASGCYLLTPGIPDSELSLASGLALQPMPPPMSDAPGWRIYCWDSPPTSSEPLGEWTNGLRLLDAHTEGDPWTSEAISVIHRWEYFGDPPYGKIYLFFNHLISDDRLIAQADGPGIHAFRWRPGDQIITRFRIPLPP
ncbi:hypothetical protein, partial [Thermoflexus sp.]|uniref:hypothetical protein n=1 Tax=Thermoflexus sp. TaxID=1969742 RepID=UPI002ADDAB83